MATTVCFIILLLISQVSSFQQFTTSSSSSSSKTFLPTTSIRYQNNIGFDSLSSSLSSSALSLSSSTSNDGNDVDDDTGIIHLTNIDSVYVISDLHTDSLENLEWLQNSTRNGKRFGPSDLIIVAGDISHELDRLRDSLRLLLDGGSTVVFVPGNHEAWLHSRNDDHLSNSIEKLDLIKQTCHELGVLTTGRPIQIIGCGSGDGTSSIEEKQPNETLWIVPLESWYDATLTINNCEDLCDDFHRWPWVDFIKCIWPKQQFPYMGGRNTKIPKGLTEYFCNKNQKILKQVESAILEETETTTASNTNTTTSSAQQQQQQQEKVTTTTILTVSHFLPNRQCLPDWKDLYSKNFDRNNWLTHGAGGHSAKFAKVAGTQLLDDQIRNLLLMTPPKSNNTTITTSSSILRRIHLFGHSHRPKDFEYDGIRYIHNPLGKPREREMYLVSPEVDFQLLWDTRQQQQQQQHDDDDDDSKEKKRRGGGGWWCGEVMANETIIRYWEEKGGGVELLKERMKKSKRRNRYDHKHMKKTSSSSSSSSSFISSSSSKKKKSSSSISSSSSSSNSRSISSSSSRRKSEETN